MTTRIQLAFWVAVAAGAAAGQQPLTSPKAGETRGNLKDGQQYVWVPAGAFAMACSASDGECGRSEPNGPLPAVWPVSASKCRCWPSINRNIAIYGNHIIDTSADDFVYALDAQTGKLDWENRIVDYRENSAQETSGPLIAAGKIVSGRGCEPKGGPDACIITAHDAKTGKEVWRVHTIPKPGEPGNESWGDIPYEQRKHVGAWMVPSYDPELHLIYIRTSVTSPAPKFMLAGNDKKYLYHNCTLALDVETGKMAWYYQHIVDHWDMDHPFERYLIDTAVSPDKSQVLWINPHQAGRAQEGADRHPWQDRHHIHARPPDRRISLGYPHCQTDSGLKNRRSHRRDVTVNPASTFSKAGEEHLICPNANGGKNWEAGAYSPLNHVMYFPLQNTCAIVAPISDKPVPNSLYAIRSKAEIPEGVDKVGDHPGDFGRDGAHHLEVRAACRNNFDCRDGRLLFPGDINGRFRAFDQDTGKILWEANLGSPVTGYPITYLANGKQHVAISTGTSLATSGLSRLTPELHPTNKNAVYVFALGE